MQIIRDQALHFKEIVKQYSSKTGQVEFQNCKVTAWVFPKWAFPKVKIQNLKFTDCQFLSGRTFAEGSMALTNGLISNLSFENCEFKSPMSMRFLGCEIDGLIMSGIKIKGMVIKECKTREIRIERSRLDTCKIGFGTCENMRIIDSKLIDTTITRNEYSNCTCQKVVLDAYSVVDAYFPVSDFVAEKGGFIATTEILKRAETDLLQVFEQNKSKKWDAFQRVENAFGDVVFSIEPEKFEYLENPKLAKAIFDVLKRYQVVENDP